LFAFFEESLTEGRRRTVKKKEVVIVDLTILNESLNPLDRWDRMSLIGQEELAEGSVP
jgi:hypothetical protein